jgi:hypothetical protein
MLVYAVPTAMSPVVTLDLGNRRDIPGTKGRSTAGKHY